MKFTKEHKQLYTKIERAFSPQAMITRETYFNLIDKSFKKPQMVTDFLNKELQRIKKQKAIGVFPISLHLNSKSYSQSMNNKRR